MHGLRCWAAAALVLTLLIGVGERRCEAKSSGGVLDGILDRDGDGLDDSLAERVAELDGRPAVRSALLQYARSLRVYLKAEPMEEVRREGRFAGSASECLHALLGAEGATRVIGEVKMLLLDTPDKVERFIATESRYGALYVLRRPVDEWPYSCWQYPQRVASAR